jgi:cellulose synthase/poly-beta-1,6-N-acetylglucosamine synthase-like glycosyltransferase
MKDGFLKTVPLQIYIAILVAPIIALYLSPRLFHFVIISYLLYGTFKSFLLTTGIILGYFRYRKEIRVNWYKKLNEIDQDIPNHLICIPVNKEEVGLVSRNIDSILNQEYDLNRIYIVVSCEEREDFASFKKKLINTYDLKLKDRLLVVQHILQSSEVKGAAANRTNGVRTAVEYLEQLSISTQDFLVTSPDADTVFHPQYLARTSFLWINDQRRLNTFYQTGAYRFDNNIIKVPYGIQMISMGISLGSLSSSVTDHKYRYTFSCFTIPLETMIKIDYWDTTISIDDSPLYWRAYNYFDGDFECKSLYIPVYVDCIDSNNYSDVYLKQYKQIHRWGWGILVFQDSVNSILNSRLKNNEKLFQIWKLNDSMIFLKAIPPTIVIYLSLFKGNYAIIETLSLISLLLIILSAPFVYKLLRENSKMSLYNTIITMALYLPLGLIHIFIYCFFPFFQAAFEFAIGKNVNKQIQWAIKMPIDNI